jgi:hypothetical protein
MQRAAKGLPVLVVVECAIKLDNVDTCANSRCVADAFAVTGRREHTTGQASYAVTFVHLPDGCTDTVLRKRQEHSLDRHVLTALVLHDFGDILALANFVDTR